MSNSNQATPAKRLAEAVESAPPLLESAPPMAFSQAAVSVDEAECIDLDQANATLTGLAKGWEVTPMGLTPVGETVRNVPPGSYMFRFDDAGRCFVMPVPVNIDTLVPLPDNTSADVLAEVKHFWGRKQSFKDFGFLWKRGVLMYGPPGSGKTTTMHLLAKEVIGSGGIVVFCNDPIFCTNGLRALRQLEPYRPVIVVFEDIDEFGGGRERALLSLLDGENQIENVVYVATTNYIERLSDRLAKRPSRFDLVVEVGMPNFAARHAFILAKAQLGSELEVVDWATKTEGLGVSHIKELIVLVQCMGLEFDASLERVKSMMPGYVANEEGEAGEEKPIEEISAELEKLLDEGLELSNQGDSDGAIDALRQVALRIDDRTVERLKEFHREQYASGGE